LFIETEISFHIENEQFTTIYDHNIIRDNFTLKAEKDGLYKFVFKNSASSEKTVSFVLSPKLPSLRFLDF
jgi:hypothetical protein